ncbi:MAG TPA: MFS transporter, partial [Burkholderiaceae bacterium]|nr:MFS transporter [Burkholderiaceae bacterium]
MTAPPAAQPHPPPPPSPADRPTSTDLGTLLRQPGYTPWWVSRLLTQLAAQMVMVALGWQMYELTASAWDLGLVGLLQFIPALLLTLPAGHLADHRDRARIVVLTQLAQWVAAAWLLAATTGGWVDRPLILALSVLLGAARAFQMPASQSLTPQLVPPALLPRALAFNSSGIQVAIIGGPALAGALFAVGIAWVYALGVAGFAAATLLMRRVRPAPRSDGPGRTDGEGRW